MITALFQAIFYLAAAAAAEGLYNATEDALAGRQRKLIFAVALLGATGQVAQVLAVWLELEILLPAFAGLNAACLLALAGAYWPILARLQRRRMRVLNRRLELRAERAERAAAAAHRWLALAEESGHVGHWQLTVPGNQLIWSDEVYRIHGLWREHYRPRLESALAVFHPVDGKRIGAALAEAQSGAVAQFEVSGRLRRPDGEIRHIILRGGAELGRGGKVEALSGVMVDVTEPKRGEGRAMPPAALRDLPLEDAVTGLADRRQFDICVGYEFKRAVRSRKPLGLVLIELDHFRAYCQHYGVMQGDACLARVAQAVQGIPRRTGDVVARFEGAQLAVLLPLADEAGALRVASAIAEAIRGLGLQHAAHERGILTVSCGAAAFLGIDDLYNPLELTRRASSALGQAKAAGGDSAAAYRVHDFATVLPPSG